MNQLIMIYLVYIRMLLVPVLPTVLLALLLPVLEGERIFGPQA